MCFRNYVEGDENQLAVNLLKAIAEKPPAHPITLITGPSGSGKTHLSNALVLRIQKRSGLKVGLTNGRQFTDCVVRSYQHRQWDALNKQLQAVDVFVFDDLDYLSGKMRSQEELLNFMRDAEQIGKSLVFTISQSGMSHVEGWNDSLRARICDIAPITLRQPSQLTLIELMRREAGKRGISLGDGEIGLLFEKCNISSQRVIEGVLALLDTYSGWLGAPVDIRLIDELSALWVGQADKGLLDSAEAKEANVFEIAEAGTRRQEGLIDIQPLLTQAVGRIDQLFRLSGNQVTGLPTGFTDLDHMTTGFRPGDLIIVAGRPSMGKTAFSLSIAESVALDAGLPVAVFSMEISSTQLVMRMIDSIGRLDQHKVRTGRLQDDDWSKLTYVVGKLNDAPIHIDETPALTAMDVRARARRLARQYGDKLGLIVIDYLQLMSGSSQSEDRSTEISEISRSLKALAIELHVPIMVLSQLNPGLEQRPNKRPIMSDLHDSGVIEQDADLVLFIYRDEVYNPDSPEKGTAEIIIGKQRNGPIGTVRMTFSGEYAKFENRQA
jgi:replicative DNA helicase